MAIGKLPRSIGGIEDHNRVHTGHIDKYPISIAINLKTLRMRRQSKIRDLARLRDVDGRERAVSIANQQTAGGGVETNIVGVATKLDRSSERVILAAKQSHGSIARVGDIDDICRWRVADALGLCESCDPVHRPVFFEVDDTNAVVAELGYQETFSHRIERHVVDPLMY
jgi:hypothetical protein